MHHTKTLAALAGLAAALPAQHIILDGNLRYTTGTLSATSQQPRALAFQTDALGTDHGFQEWWYFRVAGDTREYAFRNVGGTAEVVTTGNTHLDRDFADVDARGLLKARMDVDCYDAGPASGVVINRLTLQNTSAAPITLDLFHYIDLDITASAGDDRVTGSNTVHRVTDLTGIVVEVRGEGADVSQVGAWPTIRDLLTDTVVDNLVASSFPFAGDYSGAFQWSNRTLQPGEWGTFTVVLAADTMAACPPAVESYGIGSSLAPEIFANTVPLQDNSGLRSIDVWLENAPPSTPVGLLSNYFSAPGVNYLGVLIWVDALNGLPQFPIGITSPAGNAFYTYYVPPGPYLCGFPLYHQFFFVDGSQPVAGFTGGLMTRVGKL